MEKDVSVVDFITIIKADRQFSAIEIVDYWEADLCAIGLKKNNRLVYISTFNYVNESFVKYDFDFEILNERNSGEMRNVKKGRGITEIELIKEIKGFLIANESI